MQRLIQLVDRNDEPFIFPGNFHEKHVEMSHHLGDAYAELVREQYLKDVPHNDPLSGSQIGKPGCLLAWNKFYGAPEQKPSFALKRKWFGGHSFELEVMFWLERLAYQYEWQPTISVFGCISGHPDFVVTDDDGTKFIVECKHVGTNVFKQYKKGMSNKGYLTQFSLYCSHYQCGGLWLVGNADTGEMMTIVVPSYHQVTQHYAKYITDAIFKWKTISNANSFDECIEAGIELPLPVSRKDGSYGIEPELYSSKGVLHPVCQLYQLTYNDNLQPCVTGFNYPTQLKQYEPRWEK